MRQRVGPIVRVFAVMCLLACAAGSAAAQDEGELDLTARQRVFPGVGPGLRAVKRGADGRLYILASPSPGLLVFDAHGKQEVSIGAVAGADAIVKTGHALITFGDDCAGAADGPVYLPHRAPTLLQLFPAHPPFCPSTRLQNPRSVP